MVLAACAAIALTVWLIVLPRMVVPDLKPDLSGPPIPYDTLTSETTYPHYLSDGRKVHEDWLAAIARYPDVRDCLAPEERLADDPDLRRFDWAGVRGHMNRDICLFRVFTSLGTPERATAWLRSQGFDPHEPMPYAWGDDAGVMVGGGYSPRDDHVLLPGGPVLGRWVTAHVIYGETITARWSQDGALVSVGFSSNSL